MSAIWGHVESVVNQPKSPPSLVLNTRTPLGLAAPSASWEWVPGL